MNESAGPGHFVTFELIMCTVQHNYGHHCGKRKYCGMSTYQNDLLRSEEFHVGRFR